MQKTFKKTCAKTKKSTSVKNLNCGHHHSTLYRSSLEGYGFERALPSCCAALNFWPPKKNFLNAQCQADKKTRWAKNNAQCIGFIKMIVASGKTRFCHSAISTQQNTVCIGSFLLVFLSAWFSCPPDIVHSKSYFLASKIQSGQVGQLQANEYSMLIIHKPNEYSILIIHKHGIVHNPQIARVFRTKPNYWQYLKNFRYICTKLFQENI